MEISQNIYEKVKKEVLKRTLTKETVTTGFVHKLIYDEIKKNNLGVYFPVSISLNNCVGYNTSTDSEIKLGDIVKVEFGVCTGSAGKPVDSVNYLFGKTFVAGKEDDHYIKFLESLYIKVKEWFEMDSGDTVDSDNCTDSLRQLIESECAEARCTPVKNCLSMQQETSIDEYAPNYFYLNYTKEYDKNDYLICMENLNFDIERGDIYDINITIVPESDGALKYTYGDTTIFQLNQSVKTSLSLRSSRILYSTVKKEYNDRPFDFNRLNLSIPTAKAGLRECIKRDLFEEYPVMYVNTKGESNGQVIPVYHLKATFVKG
jgi:hypothetical protein